MADAASPKKRGRPAKKAVDAEHKEKDVSSLQTKQLGRL
jgi:hypothetical protein